MFKSFCVCLVGLCMATAAATAGDMWMGVYVGPRFNTAAGDAVKDFKNSGGTALARLHSLPAEHLLFFR